MLSTVLNILFPFRQQLSEKRIYRTDIIKLFSGVDDLKLSDPNYKLVDVGMLQKFLKRNKIDKREYKHPEHDCDDFSYILFGDVTRWDSDLAFGIAWGYTPSGTYHAFNIAIDTERQVRIIEPQTDEIFMPDNWDIRFVLM
jgi:hypothetical protein